MCKKERKSKTKTRSCPLSGRLKKKKKKKEKKTQIFKNIYFGLLPDVPLHLGNSSASHLYNGADAVPMFSHVIELVPSKHQPKSQEKEHDDPNTNLSWVLLHVICWLLVGIRDSHLLTALILEEIMNDQSSLPLWQPFQKADSKSNA